MNAISVVLIALKRLWNNKLLTLCSIVGLTAAVALISSIPLYTDAANFKVLKDELSSIEKGRVRPPFAFMYRYIGAWHGAVGIESFDPVNQYLAASVPGVIGLPLDKRTRYIKTDNFSLFPASEAAYIGIRQPLGWINVGFLDELNSHITLVDGKLPAAAGGDDEIIQVLVSQGLAEQTGLQPGERYIAFKQAKTVTAADGKSLTELRAVQLQLEIAGVWAATDEADPFWFYSPKALEATMFMPEESYRNRIAPAMDDEIYAAIWYLVFDGEAIRTDDVPALVGRINYANAQISSLLANCTLDLSPLDALQKYRWTTFVMTIVLYVFSAPILLLVLYFIGLIAGLVVSRQRGEIAIFKSRGTGDVQVIGIYALEGIMIGIVGFVGGLLIGRWLAVVMGNTVSFLAFGERQPLPVIITPRALRMALLGVSIGLLASLWPAMRAARLTIVTYKRELARAMERPVWQRFFLDFMLLIPSGYGYYVLKNRGTISFLEGQAGGDPFQDPLMFLVPALSIFAVSLLIIRIFPMVMEFLAWLSSQLVRSVSVVFAFRQLARVSSQYTGSLLLLVLTLSLATFTASMARTLDQSLYDMMYYRHGSDYQLFESGESPEDRGGASGETTTSVANTQAEEVGGWVFVPVSEHMRAPGVVDAARIGIYRADATVGKATVRGRFYGIDRLDFPRVGFYRPDFAYNSLGTLMNRLALDNSALLVSPNFLGDHSYSVGDRIDLAVSVWGQRRTIPFIIADVVRYFPTYYPEKGDLEYLFVGNLEYVFEQLGGVFPYDVWIRTDGELDTQVVKDQLYRYDINVISISGSREAIAKEQARPERTGVFGILSVGFVAAAILTVLGFLLHSLISFRRRYIEFGVLRAIGLSVGQMIGFLGVEQLLLILTGISAGTGLGILVSDLFIPFLQVGTAKNVNIPPFVVLIAWGDIIKIYAVFGAMLLVAVAGMIWFLLHLNIFEAVKLGEAV
jgi:putative ABC transport system permease protein